MNTITALLSLVLLAGGCATRHPTQQITGAKEISIRITGEPGQSYHGTMKADGQTVNADGKTPGEHKVSCRELEAVFEKGPEPGNLQFTIVSVGRGGTTSLATALSEPGSRCRITSRKNELGASWEK